MRLGIMRGIDRRDHQRLEQTLRDATHPALAAEPLRASAKADAVSVGWISRFVGKIAPAFVAGHVAILLLFTAPAFAQSHVDVVAAVKADLQARGVDLSGSCGAFQITRRVAWQLREEGVGLLLKRPEQNNCELRGVDVVVYPDGRIFDLLEDSGGRNVPRWGLADGNGKLNWMAPTDPGDPLQPQPPPIPTLPDLTPLLHRLDALEHAIVELDQRERQDNATYTQSLAVLQSVIQNLSCRARADLGFAKIPVRCEVVR